MESTVIIKAAVSNLVIWRETGQSQVISEKERVPIGCSVHALPVSRRGRAAGRAHTTSNSSILPTAALM